MIIAKFGGTSVADTPAMQRSADIVLSRPDVRVVVLSASAGVTNLLVELAMGKTKQQRDALLSQLHHIQYAILEKLPQQETIKATIDELLNNIHQLATKAEQHSCASLTDELVSYGELISTRLFVELLRQQGVNCKWFDIRNIMRTNNYFGCAEPDTQALRQLAQQHLLPCTKQELVITQGFIGASLNGQTTTLGRGGSDYTAALLAEALDAERVDIWTDVAGIYSTDPRIVTQAHRIDVISFAEAAEMATFGAKVLHPATLLPAVRSDIPVFVGSSKDPAAGGTLVCQHIDAPPLFRALTIRRNQTLLTLHSLNMLHARGFLVEVFSILARHNISVDLITTSEVSIALTLDPLGSSTAASSLLNDTLLADLSALCRVEVEGNLSLVALIGNKLSSAKSVGKKVFGMLEHYNIRLICYGASSHNLCFLVPEADANDIVRSLHANLLE